MLRRGYNYTDGSDGLGHLDAGLFFIAFVTDPRTHYVPMQMAMAKSDKMALEYLKHTGSGLFAVPRGLRRAASLVRACSREAARRRTRRCPGNSVTYGTAS
ncbi:hypothetical protein GCM10023063_05630 [Arthrobacter methylotrophus]